MEEGFCSHALCTLPCAALSLQAGGDADERPPVTPPWERPVGEHASWLLPLSTPDGSMQYMHGCMMLPSTCIGSGPAWALGWSCLACKAGHQRSHACSVQGLRRACVSPPPCMMPRTTCRERWPGPFAAAHTAARPAASRGQATGSAGGVDGGRARVLGRVCGGGGERYAGITFAVKGGSHTCLPACLSCREAPDDCSPKQRLTPLVALLKRWKACLARPC